MDLTTQTSQPNFGRHLLGKIKLGIRNNERFENLSTEIVNNIANQLLMVDDYNLRKETLNNYLNEIEKAKLIRRYHMVYESPAYNKQLNAALNHLMGQFKLRFSKYFSWHVGVSLFLFAEGSRIISGAFLFLNILRNNYD